MVFIETPLRTGGKIVLKNTMHHFGNKINKLQKIKTADWRL